jgi:hypothetical protein
MNGVNGLLGVASGGVGGVGGHVCQVVGCDSDIHKLEAAVKAQG